MIRFCCLYSQPNIPMYIFVIYYLFKRFDRIADLCGVPQYTNAQYIFCRMLSSFTKKVECSIWSAIMSTCLPKAKHPLHLKVRNETNWFSWYFYMTGNRKPSSIQSLSGVGFQFVLKKVFSYPIGFFWQQSAIKLKKCAILVMREDKQDDKSLNHSAIVSTGKDLISASTKSQSQAGLKMK